MDKTFVLFLVVVLIEFKRQSQEIQEMNEAHDRMKTSENTVQKDLKPRWSQWAKNVKKWSEEKPLQNTEAPKTKNPNAAKCSHCNGTGFLEKQRNRYGTPKCLLCDGTGEASRNESQPMPPLSTTSSAQRKESRRLSALRRKSQRKPVLEKTLSRSEKRKATFRTCISPDAWALGGKCHCSDCNKDLLRWQDSSKDINGNLVMFLFIGIVFFILPMMCSNPDSNQSPDYLGSAEEKMDKNLPLNPQEIKAVNDVIGYKSDEEAAKEIEKKHGE